MRENHGPVRRGLAELVESERRVMARTRSVQSHCVGPVFVHGEWVVIRWRFRFEYTNATVAEIEELAYQQWQGDKIWREQFFYDPARFKPRPATLG